MLTKTNLLVKLFSLTVFVSIFLNSCSAVHRIFQAKPDLQTKNLFMLTKYQQIEFPPSSDSTGYKKGNYVISEKVTFTNPDNMLNHSEGTKASGKLNEVQNLNEVVVTAKSRFTPAQNGRVKVDFVIKVPKGMVSTHWRLTLIPKLLHNDSLVALNKITLTGNEFDENYKVSKTKYDSYLSSIVDKSKYDSAFLDHKSVRRDIKKYQVDMYNKYREDWHVHKSFLTKLDKFKQQEEKLNAKLALNNAEKYSEYIRKAYVGKIQGYINDKDTSAIYNRYMDQYRSHINRNNAASQKKKDKVQNKQFDYRTGDFSLHDVTNKLMRKEDSIDVTKYNYDFKKIALNEIKGRQKDEMYKKFIKFDTDNNLRLDTLISSSQDFVYSYQQEYPVSPGLKKIRIYVDTKVEGMDESGFFSPSSDTLSYFVASLAQLADSTLKYKVYNLKKDGYNKVSTFLKYPTNNNLTFNVNYKDNKDQLLNAILFLDAVNNSKVYLVDSVLIQVSRSLNGNYEDNFNISKAQANSLKNYFQKTYSDTSFGNSFIADPKGEDWNTLVREIKSNDKIINKEGILNLLTNATIPDVCKNEIKKKYKEDYSIIQNTIFPYLDRTDLLFFVHRTDMSDQEEVRREYKGSNYEEGFKLLQNGEYWKALKFLADYGDFNTALCLACLGYNAPAYELLFKLPKTGQNHYLLAIISSRLDKNEEAVENLKEAFKLDPSLQYRIALDTEVNNLVKKNNELSKLYQ